MRLAPAVTLGKGVRIYVPRRLRQNKIYLDIEHVFDILNFFSLYTCTTL